MQRQVTAMPAVRMHKVFDTFETINEALAGW
jgi:hypothetical protein